MLLCTDEALVTLWFHLEIETVMSCQTVRNTPIVSWHLSNHYITTKGPISEPRTHTSHTLFIHLPTSDFLIFSYFFLYFITFREELVLLITTWKNWKPSSPSSKSVKLLLKIRENERKILKYFVIWIILNDSFILNSFKEQI